jgi:8-oxo-dGTP pyrophosphatase MutT (NUDIX family)
MTDQQPIITATSDQRRFAASAVAVVVFVVDREERLLLLEHPRKRAGGPQAISGALEAAETVLDAVLRETREEAGTELRVRPLGTVHASTFHYDDSVPHMISICYLLAYEGGRITPGDDMAGGTFRWWHLDELLDERVRLLVPRDRKWLAARAVELYRLWRDQTVPLEATAAERRSAP